MKLESLASSANSQKVSLAVRGAILSAGPLLILLAQSQGVDLGQSQVAEAAELAGTFISQVGAAVGTGMMIWGLVRRGWLRLVDWYYTTFSK